MTEPNFDLLVIGAGSAGTRAARIAAGYGAKVAIAEEHRIGGTCVVRGCVPKKLYVYASRFRDEFEDSIGFGWRAGAPTFDWTSLVEAKEKEVSRLSEIYRAGLEGSGARLIEARVKIDGRNAVRARDGSLIRADRILVATGGAPETLPSVPGIEHAITSNEVFDLKEFPRRILVLGGGYIAVEFATLFAKLGAEVTQAFRADRILRGFDGDLRDHLSSAMAHAGVVMMPATRIVSIAESHGVFKAKLSGRDDDLVVDQVLLAVGRAPQTRNLGLESAGVHTDERGAIGVDATSMTNVESIFAVGDVTNRINLTPVAIREGQAFADRVFGGKDVSIDYGSVPTGVFTTPEIGSVGKSEEEARRTLRVVDVYRSTFRPLKGALSGRSDKVFLKLVVDGTTDRVVGAHGIGEGLAEMAQFLAILLRTEATKADFDATVALHPTMAEEFVTMRHRFARYEQDVDTDPNEASEPPRRT